MKARLAVRLAIGILASAIVSQAQTYTVTDLGVGISNGQNRSSAAGLNNLGQAAVTFSSTFNAYASMATLISNGTRVSLGTFGPKDGSTAMAINNSGQVTGYDYLANRKAQSQAFLYSSGKLTNITSASMFPFGSTATAINDSGKVVGYAWPTGAIDHAFLYSGGKMTDLGTLGGGSTDTSVALGINDAGQVVGDSTIGGQSHGFLYSGGKMTDLGVPSGATDSTASAINANGEVIGEFFVGVTTHAARYSGGVWTDLGVNVTPTAINLSGQIIGNTGFNGGGVIYRNGKFVNLNTLIPSNSGFIITNAFAINESGQILCNATTAGQLRAILLTPVE